jgi:hypothetical protein
VPLPNSADIILGEPKLLAALRFHLLVFHPLTALRGHLSCILPPGNPTTVTVERQTTNRLVEDDAFQESALDHALVLAPALRAVSAIVRRYHAMSDDQNHEFDAYHRYLQSPRFLNGCGLASLRDPKFATLVALCSRLRNRAERAAPELFDIEPLHEN